MIHLALIGFILWIVYLFWRTNTKPLMIPVKEDKTQSDGCGSSAQEDPSTAQSPPPGEHSPSTVPSTSEQNEGPRPQIMSTSEEVETQDAEALQVLSAVRPSSTHTPVELSSGPGARERLKFILGASEDNSSDDEPVVAKLPRGAPQPRTSNQISSPQQPSCAQAESLSSTIK